MVAEMADPVRARTLLDGFLSLCAHARFRDPSSGAVGPLVRVHVHLWTRELSRLVASVGASPRMAFADDLKGEAMKNHLPVIHCRDCGAMGWGGTMRANEERVATDLQEFYSSFFGKHPRLRLLFPVQSRDGDSALDGEFTHKLCGRCLTVNAMSVDRCSACHSQEELVSVFIQDRARPGEDGTKAEGVPYSKPEESLRGTRVYGDGALAILLGNE